LLLVNGYHFSKNCARFSCIGLFLAVKNHRCSASEEAATKISPHYHHVQREYEQVRGDLPQKRKTDMGQ